MSAGFTIWHNGKKSSRQAYYIGIFKYFTLISVVLTGRISQIYTYVVGKFHIGLHGLIKYISHMDDLDLWPPLRDNKSFHARKPNKILRVDVGHQYR